MTPWAMGRGSRSRPEWSRARLRRRLHPRGLLFPRLPGSPSRRMPRHSVRGRELPIDAAAALPEAQRRRHRGRGCHMRSLEMSWLFPFQVQAYEVGGARDARVIIAHGLLTLPSYFFGWHLRQPGDKLPEVIFNALLVLRGGRNNFGQCDQPFLIEFVVVIQKTTRRFRGSLPRIGMYRDFLARRRRRLVFFDHPQ